jgi:hypothetical protein
MELGRCPQMFMNTLFSLNVLSLILHQRRRLLREPQKNVRKDLAVGAARGQVSSWGQLF